jgi:nucleoside permease NupC
VGPGKDALKWVSDRVATLIGYADEGTSFVFGPLLEVGEKDETIFALQVLPVIIFLGALIGLLYYLRVVQWATWLIGGALAKLGPEVDSLSPVTVAVVTFALAGFANFSSIAIQIGTLGSLLPERRGVVAQLGLRALLAGSLANLSNAAIAGIVISL